MEDVPLPGLGRLPKHCCAHCGDPIELGVESTGGNWVCLTPQCLMREVEWLAYALNKNARQLQRMREQIEHAAAEMRKMERRA